MVLNANQGYDMAKRLDIITKMHVAGVLGYLGNIHVIFTRLALFS